MDEKKLAEVFNDAVRDAPPATFGTGEIRRASHRANVRRRNGIVAGSVLALALLAGAGATTVALTSEKSDSTAANVAAAPGAASPDSGTMDREGNANVPAQPPGAAQSPLNNQSNRSDAPKQGGSPTGPAGGAGSTPSGCKADRGLAAALAGELPAAAKATAIQATVPFGCPEGSRGAAYMVKDGAKTGMISVVLVPPGAATFAPLGSDVQGTANAQGMAPKSGGSLHVVSQPAPGSAGAPFTDEIARYALDIGQNY